MPNERDRIMKISVILPSYLGHYQGAATNREEKLVRAVKSFQKQVMWQKELIIVADGCQETQDIYLNLYEDEADIKLISIEKQAVFSGNPRHEGITAATGDIITYLDSDDKFSSATHLSAIEKTISEKHYDWVYFDNEIGLGASKAHKTTEISCGNIGTSCIAHKPMKDARWNRCHGNGHDWQFIQLLLHENKNYGKAFQTGYAVCHIPQQLDV